MGIEIGGGSVANGVAGPLFQQGLQLTNEQRAIQSALDAFYAQQMAARNAASHTTTANNAAALALRTNQARYNDQQQQEALQRGTHAQEHQDALAQMAAQMAQRGQERGDTLQFHQDALAQSAQQRSDKMAQDLRIFQQREADRAEGRHESIQAKQDRQKELEQNAAMQQAEAQAVQEQIKQHAQERAAVMNSGADPDVISQHISHLDSAHPANIAAARAAARIEAMKRFQSAAPQEEDDTPAVGGPSLNPPQRPTQDDDAPTTSVPDQPTPAIDDAGHAPTTPDNLDLGSAPVNPDNESDPNPTVPAPYPPLWKQDNPPTTPDELQLPPPPPVIGPNPTADDTTPDSAVDALSAMMTHPYRTQAGQPTDGPSPGDRTTPGMITEDDMVNNRNQVVDPFTKQPVWGFGTMPTRGYDNGALSKAGDKYYNSENGDEALSTDGQGNLVDSTTGQIAIHKDNLTPAVLSAYKQARQKQQLPFDDDTARWGPELKDVTQDDDSPMSVKTGQQDEAGPLGAPGEPGPPSEEDETPAPAHSDEALTPQSESATDTASVPNEEPKYDGTTASVIAQGKWRKAQSKNQALHPELHVNDAKKMAMAQKKFDDAQAAAQQKTSDQKIVEEGRYQNMLRQMQDVPNGDINSFLEYRRLQQSGTPGKRVDVKGDDGTTHKEYANPYIQSEMKDIQDDIDANKPQMANMMTAPRTALDKWRQTYHHSMNSEASNLANANILETQKFATRYAADQAKAEQKAAQERAEQAAVGPPLAAAARQTEGVAAQPAPVPKPSTAPMQFGSGAEKVTTPSYDEIPAEKLAKFPAPHPGMKWVRQGKQAIEVPK